MISADGPWSEVQLAEAYSDVEWRSPFALDTSSSEAEWESAIQPAEAYSGSGWADNESLAAPRGDWVAEGFSGAIEASAGIAPYRLPREHPRGEESANVEVSPFAFTQSREAIDTISRQFADRHSADELFEAEEYVRHSDIGVGDEFSEMVSETEPLAGETTIAGEAEPDLRTALSQRLWPVAVRLMAAGGVRDENRLANFIFHAQHPELGGRSIRPDERALASDWLKIRDTVVRPALASSPLGGTRPQLLSEQRLREAWSAYRGAAGQMVSLDIFGWKTPVNPKTVDAWRALERALTASGYRAHRAWVFVDRNIAGSATASLHAYGLAIDIDHAKPMCNVNRRTPDKRLVRFSSAPTKDERCRDVQRGVADTSFTPTQVGAVEAIRTLDGHQVFTWGGRWKTTKDTMHFQINVTPQELRRGLQPDSALSPALALRTSPLSPSPSLPPLSPATGGRSIGVDALAVGDIIVSTTKAPTSRIVRGVTGSVVSHAAVFVGNPDFVVEALADGVVMPRLEEALADDSLAVAFRVPGLTAEQAQSIQYFAANQVGKKYDYAGALDAVVPNRVGAGLVAAAGGAVAAWVWRKVDLGKGNSKFFCSELVYESYRQAGHPLTRTGSDAMLPEDIVALKLEYVGHLRT